MQPLLSLSSLVAFSLFFSLIFKRSSSLMPIFVLSFAMLWFTFWGCLGLFPFGGWAWYIASVAALAFVIVKEKKQILQLFTPGLLLFACGGILFALVFFSTKPMLTQWDEFSFWGTAAKITTNTNQLYTTAQSNLVARAAPPSLLVFNYMVQFFSGSFKEYQLMTSLSFIYLACFAPLCTLWKKNKWGAVAVFITMCFLPFFFETSTAQGDMSYTYLSCMADLPLATLFGGAICFYFSSEEKSFTTFFSLGIILAALTNVKDMGLALALLALFIVMLDALFCEREAISFLHLKRWPALLANGAMLFVFIALAYLIWVLHLQVESGINRFNVGSAGQKLSQIQLLTTGGKALLGIQQTPQFQTVSKLMWQALFNRNISLIGSGMRILVLILALSIMAWLLSSTKRSRRRVLVFTIGMAFCFSAFYAFNTITYSFILKEAEAFILKDYERYIMPLWFGWLMGTINMLCLTVAASFEKCKTLKQTNRRLARGQTARSVLLGASFLIITAVLIRGNLNANFSNISPSIYSQRSSVKTVLMAGLDAGMQPSDKVYVLSQNDDGSRFYMFAYEMQAPLQFAFTGPLRKNDGTAILNEDGTPRYTGASAGTLVAAEDTSSALNNPTPCTPEEFMAYLKQIGATHIMLDIVDDYFVNTYALFFSDGLEGWEPSKSNTVGARYYSLQWQGSTCTFVPAKGGAN